MSNRQTGMTRGLKMLFGIFMVLVYLGMALLLAINFFDWSLTPTWNVVRWFFVVIFAAYGIYRGYREVKGEHTYGMRAYDEEENGYTTYSREHKTQIENNNEDK